MNNKGYGQFSPNAKTGKKLAHRLAYAEKHGPIPDGLCVLHRCDTPLCVNPAHLFLGTKKDNNADKIAKGRCYTGDHRGENSGTSKFTAQQIIAMRRAYVSGERAYDIADRFGVRRTGVHDILTGRSWKHLLGADGCPTLEELKAAAAKATRNNTKVTADQVREIKKALSLGEDCASIGRRYNLHKGAVHDIKTGKNWPEITYP